MRQQRGFTLMEIMITLAILGVLGTIAVPIYQNYVSTAKETEAKVNLETLRLLEEQYYADNGKYIAGASTATLEGIFGKSFKPAARYYKFKVECSTDQVFLATAEDMNSPATLQTYTINHNNVKTPSGW